MIFEANPEWEDRFQFQHVTRWNHKANPDNFKWKNYSVRNQRFRLVEGVLYDMENDPGQTKDVTSEHPELVSEMKQAYEKFWDNARPLMINEDVPLAGERPYHVNYHEQNEVTGIPAWQAPELDWVESDARNKKKLKSHYTTKNRLIE